MSFIPDDARAALRGWLDQRPPQTHAYAYLSGGARTHLQWDHDAFTEVARREHWRLTLRLAKRVKKTWREAQVHSMWSGTDALPALMARAVDLLDVAPINPWYTPPPVDPVNIDPDLLKAIDPGLIDPPDVVAIDLLARAVISSRRRGWQPSIRLDVGLGALSANDHLDVISVANSRGHQQEFAATSGRLEVTLTHQGRATLVGVHEGVRRVHLNGAALVESLLGLERNNAPWTDVVAPPTLLAKTTPAIVLDRPAVVGLLMPMLKAFSAHRVIEGDSPFGEMQGRRLFHNNLSLRCDLTHPEFQGRPFDDSGLQTLLISLINKGMINDFVYNHHTAQRAGVVSTGHGVLTPHGLDERPRFAVMEGAKDDVTLGTLLTTDGLAVLIQHWSNLRPIDAKHMIFEATAPQPLVFDEGRFRARLPVTRYRVDLFKVFSQIEAYGTARRTLGAVVPPLRVSRLG